jgi:hypothetical protein
VIASLWDRGRYASGEAYPGVLALLAEQGEHLVVLTARPSVAGMVSGKTREKFVALFRLEAVEARRVAISVAPGDLDEILSTLEMGLRKAETLILQRRLFPEAASVFNGDSGQGDWIAALILRDIDPAGFPYATVHDVRPWSPTHREAMVRAVRESAWIEGIYRRHAGLRPEGDLAAAERERLDAALVRFRGDLERALAGPGGRLDGAFLRTKRIFLFRNHAALALDLADAGLLDGAAADRVVAACARDLRFLGPNPFGYDDTEGRQLLERLAARALPASEGEDR